MRSLTSSVKDVALVMRALLQSTPLKYIIHNFRTGWKLGSGQ